MPPRSNILKYPAEIIAYLNQCLDDPKNTYQDATDLVNALIIDKYPDEIETNHSQVGRYAKKRRENFERAARKMAEQQARRNEFFERFGDKGLDNAGRYSAEQLYSSIMDLQHLQAKLQSNMDGMDAGDLFQYSKIAKNIASTIATLERTLTENKARVDAIKRQAMEEAASAMEEEAKRTNTSGDVTTKLREAIMSGLKDG